MSHGQAGKDQSGGGEEGHDMTRQPDRALPLLVACLLVLPGLPGPARAAVDDDLFLFTSNFPPNVMLIQDNSTSMNHIEWHPKFDPLALPSCAWVENDKDYFVTSDVTGMPVDNGNPIPGCKNTRTIFGPVNPTLWSGRYLNWYFSDDADAYVSEIETAVATPAPCNQAVVNNPEFAEVYRRTRAMAAKQVMLDTLCEAEERGVRFGAAQFRGPQDVLEVDSNGGYVAVAIEDPSPAHAKDLEAQIGNIKADASTPLAETLFQIYTYFMSRNAADLPRGIDPAASFPGYAYKLATGDFTSTASQIPPDIVEAACQKCFVILVTDGSPDRDDFDADPLGTAQGFARFGQLIGDYNQDGELEVPGNAVETSWYLDDIALYMHEKDFRPDLDGEQTFDVYTIGLATEPATNDFLRRTAEVGGGRFFHAQDGEELGAALLAAINDIIEKSQSFTAATVPSSRTADGGDFYTSFFLPSGKRAFWEGHLRAWHITAAGDILDANGNCALFDSDPGECNSGSFDPAAVPFWDAGEQVPAPALRTLYTSLLGGAGPDRAPFDAGLTAADLGIEAFATPGSPPDPSPNSSLYTLAGSTATHEEGLADEVVAYARGCDFGTGVGTNVETPAPCAARSWRLGDIFHSNPAVIGRPKARIGEASYVDFKAAYASRRRVIYAGANGGFLHAFDAGAWDAAATPPAYAPGTGAELFGFMPWQARRNIKNQPIDTPTARTYFVDGSPQVTDVWLYSSPSDSDKDPTEWHTVLVGGMRQGGSQYFALDVTDPNSAGYPGYLWEFPQEPADPALPGPDLPYLGESWGQPIVTRVKVHYDGVVKERWVAIVAGGYAISGDPNRSADYDPSATAGRAIFMLDLANGEILAEQRFSPAAADDRQFMRYAIPSTPAVFDLDSDGFADVVYVGDLGGNIWKWSIKDVGEDRIHEPTGAKDQPAWEFGLFFRAPPAMVSGRRYYKSFFTTPAGALSGGKLFLAFGSGERANLGFAGLSSTTSENNRFYVLTDADPLELVAPFASLTEADLTDLTASARCASLATPGYFFVVEDGEKFVTRTDIFAGLVVAGSFKPSLSGDPCTSKGDGTLYVFDVACGEGHFSDASSAPTRSLDIGAGFPTDPQISLGVGGADNRIYVEKSGGDLWSTEAPDTADVGGLLYWRETP